jgi:hypothetical protein
MAAVNDLVIASATVKRGKLFVRNRRAFDEQVAQLKEGWELELTLKRRRATRSIQANRYYWGGVIDKLCQHCDQNYTPEEMHEILKAKFIPKKLALADGNGEIVFEMVLGGSTRSMNTNEFYDYVESIRMWAAETLGCDIPDPDEPF